MDETRQWIANIIHAHRELIFVDFPGITADKVLPVLGTTGDTYEDIRQAFATIGYDIEK